MKFIIGRWLKILKSFFREAFLSSREMGYCGKNVFIYPSVYISNPANLFMYENTIIFGDSNIECTRAKFIMKKNSGAAKGLTVVTGNHMLIPGRWFNEVTDKYKDRMPEGKLYDKDVIVNEDVWIGMNVTLLSGVEIGRGAIIGAGSVCRCNIPAYSIVIGNPAKVIGFKFPPRIILEHEMSLYKEEERLSLEYLEKNYKKYFLDRIHEIADFSSVH
jgi:acetyltransferase-like isoleucine patch superfamily enzyme